MDPKEETPNTAQPVETVEKYVHIPGAKLVPPPGMTKSQYKKQLKRERWAIERPQMRANKRAKLKAKKAETREQIAELAAKGESYAHLLRRRPGADLKRDENGQQKVSGFGIVLDCGYDDLMNEKEVVSLSNQITRSYSNNRIGLHRAQLVVTGLDKRLKTRFDNRIKDYKLWKKEWIQFSEDPLEANLKQFTFDNGQKLKEDYSNVVYLSADTDDMITELEPDHVYVVGGIVDKGRHKGLCKATADKLGIRTARLPIDEFIDINGRKVLTTSHVVELLLRWDELKDWKQAFEQVLPPRKLHEDKGEQDEDDEEEEEDEEKKDEESNDN